MTNQQTLAVIWEDVFEFIGALVSYFSIAVIRQWPRQLMRESISLGSGSRRLESVTVVRRHGGPSSHLDPQVGGREYTGNGGSL